MARAPWAGEFLSALRPETLTQWATDRTNAKGADKAVSEVPATGDGSGTSTEKAKRRRKVRAVSGATVNRNLNLGSALFRWAIRMGHVTDNPFRGVERFSEKGRAREVYLTAKEAHALVESAAPFLRPVLIAAVSTGMRRGELLSLRWRSVDLERKELRVEAATEKAGRGRVVPLTPWLLSELTTLKASREVPALDGSDPVFRSSDGSPLTEKVLRVAYVSAVRRCEGIPLDKRAGCTFHALRHTAASLMVAAGVPIFDVAKVLGHSTLGVTLRYAHFAPAAGRSALDRLGEALGRPGDSGAGVAGKAG
jgi:integrase